MKILNVTELRFNDMMSSRSKVTTLLCWPHLLSLSSLLNAPRERANGKKETSCAFRETIFLVMLSEISFCFPDIITLKLSKLRGTLLLPNTLR